MFSRSTYFLFPSRKKRQKTIPKHNIVYMWFMYSDLQKESILQFILLLL